MTSRSLPLHSTSCQVSDGMKRVLIALLVPLAAQRLRRRDRRQDGGRCRHRAGQGRCSRGQCRHAKPEKGGRKARAGAAQGGGGAWQAGSHGAGALPQGPGRFADATTAPAVAAALRYFLDTEYNGVGGALLCLALVPGRRRRAVHDARVRRPAEPMGPAQCRPLSRQVPDSFPVAPPAAERMPRTLLDTLPAPRPRSR